jgi:hypothetical protein
MDKSVVKMARRTFGAIKSRYLAALAFLALVWFAPSSHAAFDTNITNMIDDLSSFFSTKIIPWVVLVMGVILIGGLIMRFRKGTVR